MRRRSGPIPPLGDGRVHFLRVFRQRQSPSLAQVQRSSLQSVLPYNTISRGPKEQRPFLHICGSPRAIRQRALQAQPLRLPTLHRSPPRRVFAPTPLVPVCVPHQGYVRRLSVVVARQMCVVPSGMGGSHPDFQNMLVGSLPRRSHPALAISVTHRALSVVCPHFKMADCLSSNLLQREKKTPGRR